jgi:Uri superfamily endonuclease
MSDDAGTVVSMDPAVPSSRGTYVLVLTVHWESIIDVGRLGELVFAAGRWLYCGSALGPGGLAARVRHHSNFHENPRWHIDYLRLAASLTEVWYARSSARLEHQWAGLIAGIDGGERGIPGFGCSDCECPSHLFHAGRRSVFEDFRKLAGKQIERSIAVRGNAVSR